MHARIHAMHIAYVSHAHFISTSVTHTHAHILVRTGSTHRIVRYDLRMSSRMALKAEDPEPDHELAHTCTLARAPINTQPDPRAVG